MDSKQKKILHIRPIEHQQGFTIMELLVVIFMMAIIASLFVANYAGTRGPRNLRIAQNQLISNLRKYQSYTLSSRNAPTGNPARFYVIRFSNADLTTYTVQVIDNTTPATIVNTETFTLPSGITFSASAPFVVQQPIGSSNVNASCVQVGFLLPFSKTYMDRTCSLQTISDSPAELDVLKNSRLTITLRDSATSASRAVEINAVTGSILPQ